MSEYRAWSFINLHCESYICFCARWCGCNVNLCSAPEISHTLGCGRLCAQWQKPLYAPRCEMSPRCTEGDSLAPRCTAQCIINGRGTSPGQPPDFAQGTKKENQYETKLLHLLHYSAMNLYSNFLREVWSNFRHPQVSAIADAVLWAHEAWCEHFQIINVLDNLKAPREQASLQAAGALKQTKKKKRCYLNPLGCFTCALRGRRWQLSQRIMYLSHYTAVVSSKPISSSSSYSFHHHLAANTANGRR